MILCCGEALIDMLPRQSTLGENAYAPYAGGAIFNTAIALGRLGMPTGFFTGLSDDMLGDVLRETLAAANVDFSFCAISARPTTVAFVKLVNGSATYAFYDEGTAESRIQAATVDQRAILGAFVEAFGHREILLGDADHIEKRDLVGGAPQAHAPIAAT